MNLQKIAEKNQAYYLEEQKADNCQDKWFRYVKTLDSYAEPIAITPAMAEEALLTDNFDLRKPLDPQRIRVFADEIEKKAHTLTFSFSGRLLDGRILLEAILLRAKPVVVFVSFNVSDKLSFLFE